MRQADLMRAEPAEHQRVYRAHRQRQRRRILDTAKKLFDARGMDRVTMADIIAQGGFRAATLYQYFANKDEIIWALVGEAIAAYAAEADKVMASVCGPALAKIKALLEHMAEELEHHPGRVRLMAQFDAMYARDWSAERLVALEQDVMPRGFVRLTELIREGIADGSLRPDLNPELTMHSVLNAAIGAQRRLASLAGRAEAEYGQSVERLFREAIRVILLGLRA
jgi:AcrR family transcriptional regulator